MLSSFVTGAVFTSIPAVVKAALSGAKIVSVPVVSDPFKFVRSNAVFKAEKSGEVAIISPRVGSGRVTPAALSSAQATAKREITATSKAMFFIVLEFFIHINL
jgi:hypothetical protein